MKKRKGDHCQIVRNNTFGCLRCGDEYAVEMGQRGVSINIFVAISKAFAKDHARCKPALDDAGKPVDWRHVKSHARGLRGWRDGWDTGRSSLAIWHAAVSGSVPYKYKQPPRDPSDFGRCYRLIKFHLTDRAKKVLKVVADSAPAWRPFVDAWDELTLMFEDVIEGGADTAPALYERLKALAAVAPCPICGAPHPADGRCGMGS